MLAYFLKSSLTHIFWKKLLWNKHLLNNQTQFFFFFLPCLPITNHWSSLAPVTLWPYITSFQTTIQVHRNQRDFRCMHSNFCNMQQSLKGSSDFSKTGSVSKKIGSGCNARQCRQSGTKNISHWVSLSAVL